jgi:hypothetical protein
VVFQTISSQVQRVVSMRLCEDVTSSRDIRFQPVRGNLNLVMVSSSSRTLNSTLSPRARAIQSSGRVRRDWRSDTTNSEAPSLSTSHLEGNDTK